jgi:ATP-dependent DNA ligase
MTLPIEPPVAPMLARLTREVPSGAYAYEPKWDGFRCLAFRDGDDVDLRSRHDRPLARYFPEVVAAIRSLPEGRLVLDGEIILVRPTGFDFAALMSRLHPAASRVERLAAEAPAAYVVFDILAMTDTDLRARPFTDRRAILERLFECAEAAPRPRHPGIRLTPTTHDDRVASDWLARFRGGGLDGVVAKPLDGRYEPGRRSMVKVKATRTADCVLAGVRLLPDATVSSLLLGLYDDAGSLRHVGVVTQLPRDARRELVDDLRPDAIPIEEHPWHAGFAIERSPLGRLLGSASRWTPEMGLDWVPLAPRRVVEVAFDQVDVDRFRHPARLVRWRPDRDPESCSLDQIMVAGDPELLAPTAS